MKKLLIVLSCCGLLACETEVVDAANAVEGTAAVDLVKVKVKVEAPSTQCAQLDGQTWQSVEELDAGRSLNGMAKMNWTLGFVGEQFRWRYADVVEMGTYRCEGERVVMSSSMDDPRASGNFVDTELIINDVRYVLQNK